jgi:uncharacterized protein
MLTKENSFHPGIFIMMKYPEAGKAKMRLAQSLGKEAATSLYRAFIQDTLETVQSLDITYHIAIHPPESQEAFVQWLGSSHQFVRQKGMNLGERLQNAFLTMFKKGYQQVIALASDSPDLPVEILRQAISSLQTHKVVIGPATDGGYYLIGFSHDFFLPEVFQNISWSTDTVLRDTLSRIEAKTSQIHLLPEWRDIDNKRDLQEFYEKYRYQKSKDLHSMKYLHSHPKLIQMLFS